MLTFHIAPFRSDYQALLGRIAFARFNAVPHYAYCKLKMPGPRGVIAVKGKAELPVGTKEHTVDLTAEATSGTFQRNLDSTARFLDIAKGLQTTSR